MICFTIPSDPVAQGRPRTAVIAGRAQIYDPAKSRTYKNLVRAIARTYAPEALLSEALVLTVKIYKSTPRGFSKKKKADAIIGKLAPTTRPDLSNYIKAIEDSLTNVIFIDDSQIVKLICSKHYSDNPRVEVVIESLFEYENSPK